MIFIRGNSISCLKDASGGLGGQGDSMKPNYFDLNKKEKRIYRARKKLGDDLLADFFRVMGENPDILAIKLMNDALDEDRSFDEIFYNGDIYGFFLSAKDIDEQTIELEFGFQAGPLAGDGNTYHLVFAEDDYYDIYPGSAWIS